jgi:hypothetical protein
MKWPLISILLLSLLFAGCRKTDKPPRTTGTETIDNILDETSPYFATGFNFSTAEKTSSLSTPKPDIILELGGTIDIFILQTNAGLNGFFLEGEYNDAASAELAFDNLTEPLVNDWAEWANPVKTNQVWVYRSADEHYAKLRIIATFSEARDPRDFASCTFEWVYQPDGSLTFPGK